MEYLSAYAPELNPAEYVWNQTDHALNNSAPENMAELHGMLKKLDTKDTRIPKAAFLMYLCFGFTMGPVTVSITYANLNNS